MRLATAKPGGKNNCLTNILPEEGSRGRLLPAIKAPQPNAALSLDEHAMTTGIISVRELLSLLWSGHNLDDCCCLSRKLLHL